MARTDESVKMEQSSRIASIGCFAIVLILILLILIGGVMVRSDLSAKRSKAIGSLGRMQEQVEKAPGIFDRMMAYDCAMGAEDDVAAARDRVESLGPVQDLAPLESVWTEVENTWNSISAGCSGERGGPGFSDLEIEIEGVRNRYSVEKGKFREDADVYNAALRTLFGSFFGWGYEPL